MATRMRKTWTQGVDRHASAPPAIPSEPGGHPAEQSPDPEVAKYDTGNPSAWAEDIHPPPYQNANEPALPDEDGAHPADETNGGKAASQRDYEAWAHLKAEKCIRIASALLPKAETDVVEKQAVDLMSLPDSLVDATLHRLAMYMDDDEGMGEEWVMDQGMDDDFDDFDDFDEFDDVSEEEMMLARMLQARAAKDQSEAESDGENVGDDDGMEKGPEEGKKAKKSTDDEDEDDESEVASKKAKKSEGDESAKRKDPGEDEDADDQGGSDTIDDDEAPEADKNASDIDFDALDREAADETGIEFDTVDPFDLTAGDEQTLSAADEDAAIDLIFPELKAAREAAAAEAAPQPQPKKAGGGVQSVGNISKAASAGGVGLGDLWASAPDVSEVFDVPRTSTRRD